MEEVENYGDHGSEPRVTEEGPDGSGPDIRLDATAVHNRSTNAASAVEEIRLAQLRRIMLLSPEHVLQLEEIRLSNLTAEDAEIEAIQERSWKGNRIGD